MYLPYNQRKVDNQYQNLLKEILEKGLREEKTQLVNKENQRVGAISLFGARPMVFNLNNGFPMITERSMSSFWRGPVGEIFAFINGVRHQEQLERFGCHWWKAWVTEKKCSKRGLQTGDLGPGSYGPAFHDFPTTEGQPFNQFKHLVEQIKEFPHLRTHIITPFIPQYIVRGKGKIQKVVVVPCHGLIQVRIIGKKLTLTMVQRSGDVPIGVPSNMVQYAALTLALAHVTGYEPYQYVHTILDAHIYEDQVSLVREIISQRPKKFPTVRMVNPPNNIFSFRKENFVLSNYHPRPPIPNIPVAT